MKRYLLVILMSIFVFGFGCSQGANNITGPSTSTDTSARSIRADITALPEGKSN